MFANEFAVTCAMTQMNWKRVQEKKTFITICESFKQIAGATFADGSIVFLF